MRSEMLEALERRYPGARLEPLAGDASTRRFYRLRPDAGESLVVMDYGRPYDGETDDVTLTRLLRSAGLPVPAVVAAFPQPGFLLVEDLGDRTLEQRLAAGGDPERLYERAVDLAVRLAVNGTEALASSPRAAGPSLDADRFRFEMSFFVEHFVVAHRGQRPDPALERELETLADTAADTPRKVLSHRDYHSRNLMVTDDDGLAMVDIQDARWGPLAYDLASLLRDAYVDLSEKRVERLRERFRAAVPDAPAEGVFAERFDVVAAQRMLKALGTFGYQRAVVGTDRYAEAAERTCRRLRRLLPRRAATAHLLPLLDPLL